MARSTRTQESVKNTVNLTDCSRLVRPDALPHGTSMRALLRAYAEDFEVDGVAAHALIELARRDSSTVISAVLAKIKRQPEYADGRCNWQTLLAALAQEGVAGAIDAVLGVLRDSKKAECRVLMARHCRNLVDDERIVQSLVEALKDEDEFVRAYAMCALTNAKDSHVPEVVVAVAALLDDPDPGVCNDTAAAFKKFGAAARYALPSLRSMIQAGQKQVVALARRSRAAEGDERTLLLSDLAEMRSSVRFLKHVEKSIIASTGA